MATHSGMRDRTLDERGFGLVETLIGVTILVIGLVAVSGLSLASADRARIATWRAEQATAGRIMLEHVQRDGWAAAVNGVDTVSVAGHGHDSTRHDRDWRGSAAGQLSTGPEEERPVLRCPHSGGRQFASWPASPW